MSLRRRFLLIVAVAVVALGATTVPVLRLRAAGVTDREKAAFDAAAGLLPLDRDQVMEARRASGGRTAAAVLTGATGASVGLIP